MVEDLKLISLLRKCFSEDIICMFYRGDFDDTFTDKLISLADYDVEKKAKKRISFLMSESFQNIVRHGNDDFDSQIASVFAIRAVAPFLHIFSCNLVNMKDKLFLEEKLNVINNLDKDQLKAYYSQVLEEGTISKKGGAGLGLIEMAKKSQKPIQTAFRQLENDCFDFNMQIDLIINDQANSDLLGNPMSIEENISIQDLITDRNLIFLYKGDFSDEIITPMLNILEGNTSYPDDSVGFNIYHTAVELMQNVTRHALVTERKEGVFAIHKTEKGYYLCTGNYFTNHENELEKYFKKLNEMNKEDLDSLYRNQLKANVNLPNNNAGVGLIDLRRSLMTLLDIKIEEEQNRSFLMMGIEIPIDNGK